jgi:hypothetical protein
MVVLTLAALATTVLRPRRRGAPEDTTAEKAVTGSDRLYIGGLDYSAYDGSEPVYRVSAAQVIHRKRKVGPLTLNPVKEVEIDGLRVDLLPRRSGSGGGMPPPPRSLDAILKELLASKNLGFVSRVVLKDIAIEDRSGRGEPFRFAAEEVVWRPGDKRLVVHGPFEHLDGTGSHRGTDGAFDLAADGRLVRVP